jgi:hypothetical protein
MTVKTRLWSLCAVVCLSAPAQAARQPKGILIDPNRVSLRSHDNDCGAVAVQVVASGFQISEKEYLRRDLGPLKRAGQMAGKGALVLGGAAASALLFNPLPLIGAIGGAVVLSKDPVVKLANCPRLTEEARGEAQKHIDTQNAVLEKARLASRLVVVDRKGRIQPTELAIPEGAEKIVQDNNPLVDETTADLPKFTPKHANYRPKSPCDFADYDREEVAITGLYRGIAIWDYEHSPLFKPGCGEESSKVMLPALQPSVPIQQTEPVYNLSSPGHT